MLKSNELPKKEVEIWKPIPSIESYEASSFGRIRSLDRLRPFRNSYRKHKGRILKPRHKPNGWGGFYKCIYVDGGKYKQINRLVCEAFNGFAPSNTHEAAHLNGNSLDDRPCNLCWATPKENASHKKLHGTEAKGEKNGQSKLKGSNIEEIFDRFIGGEKSSEISKRYGMKCIGHILRRKTWMHIHISEKKILAAKNKAKSNILAACLETNRKRHLAAMGRV